MANWPLNSFDSANFNAEISFVVSGSAFCRVSHCTFFSAAHPRFQHRGTEPDAAPEKDEGDFE
jgi:hypothetical protein